MEPGSKTEEKAESVNAVTTREVRVENDEYEREQQRLAKQIKRHVASFRS